MADLADKKNSTGENSKPGSDKIEGIESQEPVPIDVAPLDLHFSPPNTSAALPVTPESLNKSTESLDSKNSSGDSPSKSRRKRKPNITKKVSASDLSETHSEAEKEIEPLVLPAVIPNEPIKEIVESSDCETIDKIAQMVSTITAEDVVMKSPVQETKKLDKSSDELIEHQLEQMFAESQEANIPQPAGPAEPSSSTTEPPQEVKKKKPQSKPRKKKVEGEPSKKKAAATVATKMKNGKPSKKKGKGVEEPSKKDSKKKSKDKSKVKADVAPFVQLQKDGTFTIVNQTVNGDDDTEKSVNKPKKGLNVEKNKAIRGLHVSTLSNKYDADKRDTTWICVFCKLGPHKHKLGDLFGPYIVSKSSEEFSHCVQDPATDVFRQTNKDKFKPVSPTPASPEKPKKKKKLNDSTAKSVTSPTVGGPVSEELFTGMAKVDENNFEVWFHEDCIVWSNGVYIIGTKVMGLEAAIWSSTRFRCAYCSKNGAMLSCLSRDCHKPAHIGCAKTTWKLDEDFKTLCETHHG